MTVWTSKATELADTFPTVLRLPDEKPGDIPGITQPLDKGAATLLAGLSPDTTKLEYSPFFVERLMDDIANHIAACTRIRDQAQQLEVQAFREMMDLETRQRVNALIAAHLPTAKTREPSLISNQTTLTVGTGSVSSPPGASPDPYWTTMWNWQDGKLSAAEDEVMQRIAKYSEPGNGNNYVERFGFLKQLFDQELVILYKKILAASVGLKEIFGLSYPPPAIIDIGYLNQLTFWAEQASNSLQKSFHGIDTLTVIIPFHDSNAAIDPPPGGLGLMSHDKFLPARQAGAITFTLSEAAFALPGAGGTPKNPRLRGFDLWFVDKANLSPVPAWSSVTAFRGSITLPNQSPQMDFVGRPATIAVPFLLVNHLTLLTSVPDVRSYRKSYNASPIGTWSLRLEKSLKGDDPKAMTEDNLFNLFIRLQIVHQSAA